MKKSVAIAAVSIVSLLGFASQPAFSGESDKTPVSEYCATHGDLGLSHGACVAYITAHNLTPHDASVCREEWIQSSLGVENPGQCVKKLGEMRN